MRRLLCCLRVLATSAFSTGQPNGLACRARVQSRASHPHLREATDSLSIGDPGYFGSPSDVVDPIYRDELWVRGESVRYGDSSAGGGSGYCASYLPSTAAGNHSRAVLCLNTDPSYASREAVQSFTQRVALSCECVALFSQLEGGPSRWTHDELAHEFLTACRYLNREFHTEGLAVIAMGAGAKSILELLASGGVDAHAAIIITPQDLRGAARAAHDIMVPLLAICAEAADAAEIRSGLEMNSCLAKDYYVAHFEGLSPSFVLSPRDAGAESGSERAVALIQAWIDRYVPG